jgi:hypothetical protein
VQLAVKQLGEDGLRGLIDDLGQLEQKLLSLAEFARAASAHCPELWRGTELAQIMKWRQL